ncbi:MAG: ribokinase [Actinomycetota bacterium]|nr:ribokinase [Actinomycetota bacterium]
MAEDGQVLVVGSLNEDLRLRTPTVPAAGETVLGGPHDWGLGGKGSNQAIAAARYGATVAMIGLLGDDAGAEKIRAAFDAEGIDTTLLGTSTDAATGLALIVLEPSGENRIIVSAGANLQLTVAGVTAASDRVAGAAVVLAQLEIPLPVVQAAFDNARGTTVLNAAPAQQLPAELLAATEVLVVNEGELAMIAGLAGAASVAGVPAIVGACGGIVGPSTVIVTRGAAGAVVVDAAGPTEVPAPQVDAIDTTGAGDCFCGVLAASLAEGVEIHQAAMIAVRAASLAATRLGAAEGMPRRDEL